MSEPISQETLKTLFSTGSVQDVALIKLPASGYYLQIQSGLNVYVLKSQRQQHRVFKSLDTASKFLKSINIFKFRVVTS